MSGLTSAATGFILQSRVLTPPSNADAAFALVKIARAAGWPGPDAASLWKIILAASLVSCDFHFVI
jgi:hypothetical protein